MAYYVINSLSHNPLLKIVEVPTRDRMRNQKNVGSVEGEQHRIVSESIRIDLPGEQISVLNL